MCEVILKYKYFYSKEALTRNQDLEFERNKERFQFLRVIFHNSWDHILIEARIINRIFDFLL